MASPASYVYVAELELLAMAGSSVSEMPQWIFPSTERDEKPTARKEMCRFHVTAIVEKQLFYFSCQCRLKAAIT